MIAATRCKDCGIGMIPNQRWRKLSTADKASSGKRQHRGKGMCSRCYEVVRKAGGLPDHEGATIKADVLLEDAIFLVDERGLRYRDLPAALGVTRQRLTRAVKRALPDERATRLHALNAYTGRYAAS